MAMHDPAPPGELLAGWLEDLDMSVTAFAAHVGIRTGKGEMNHKSRPPPR